MEVVKKYLHKLPGFGYNSSNFKKVIASVTYGFILLFILVLIIPTSPTLALAENKPTKYSNTDIKGKTSLNKPVFLIQNGQVLLQTKSTSSGEFSFHFNSLPEGNHTYSVEACRDETRKLCRSEQTTLVIDLTPPTTPKLSSSQEETNNGKLVISGEGEAGSKVKVLLNGEEKAGSSISPDGKFQTEITLSEGSNTILAVSEDEAGNRSSLSNEIAVNYTKPNVGGVQTETVKVTRVIDGDTIEIEGGERVRYIGIDTPETVDPRTTVQCYGKEASNKNKELVEGKEVRLEKDVSETDKYDRLLRYIWIGDTLINEVLVKEGFAYSSSYPPDVKYQDRFIAAQKEARNNNRGLWGTCTTPTVKPTSSYVTPTNIPYVPQPTNPPQSGGSSYVCDCSKTCDEMVSCDEAYYQLNTCGCSKRDGDKDGVPCENICPGG